MELENDVNSKGKLKEHINTIDYHSYSDEQEPKRCCTIFTFIRLFLIVGGLVGIGLNSIYGFALPHGDIECLQDYSFELFRLVF